MPMKEQEVQDLKSLWRDDWEVMFCTDGSELLGAITRAEIDLCFGGEGVGVISYDGLDELLDAPTMCRRLEEELGITLTLNQWHVLLYSLIISHSMMDEVQRIVRRVR